MADGQIRYKVGFDIQKKGLDQLKASLQDLQKMKISDIMKINGSTASEAKAIFRDIQDQASKVEEALTRAFNPKLNAFNLQAFNTALKNADLNLDKIYQDFSKAGTTGQVAFRQLSNQLLRVNNRVRESHAILDKMATTLANTIKWNAASGAVNGLTRSVQQAWGYVKALDGSLNDIRIVTGKSADDMANFAVQANNAAKELGRTTTDYTNAALIFAQQGLSDAEVEQRARITLKAANVTGQSTDAVSEQLTAVWNGYKVTAEEAQLYVDRLAAVAATTASDLEELSTGMSKVASAAAAMGVGEDQLAAQLSTIISVTRQAPETVGTALRTVYARISDIEAGIEEDGVTLGKYSGEMEALGFNVLDASGHLRDMGEVMQEIGGRWNYLTREQQVSLAQTMAGQRQYSNLIALFDNFQKYDQALYTAQNAAGTLQEQQDIAMESMGAHLNVLKASIQDVYDSLVNQDALDAIKGLVDGLANASTTVAKLIDSVGGGIPILTSLGALGFSVFTNQIAGSIQTTINNFQAAQREAQELQRKIKMIEDSRGTGDATTQALSKRREEILSMSPNLSDSMTQELQKGLDDWVEAANKVDLIKAKFEKLKGTFETAAPSLEDFILGYKDLSEALSTDTGIQQIKEGLKQVQKQFGPVEDSYKILREAVIDFNRQTDEVGKTKSFEFLKDQVNELVNTLQSAKTDSGKEIFKTLPQEAQESIRQAQEKINSLDFSALSPSEAQGQITGAFQQIAKVITSRIEAIKKAIQSADDGTLPKLAEQLEAAKKALEATEEASNKQMEQATNAVRVKNLTDMASGFSRVAAGILQIKNLGRIWTQQDVSLGDKILQTVQNLAFSLPMLISGLKAASIGLKILTIEEGALAKSTIKNIWGENAHAIAIKFTGDSAQKAAIQVKFFDQVLKISSGAIVLTVLAGVAAALIAIADGFEKARKAAIEHDKEILNQQKDIQKEIDSHKELYKTLDDLKEKYSQNQITRAELKGQIQNLIAQYGLEGEAAEALRENYTDLAKAALELQKVQAQRGIDSATQGMNAAEDKLKNELKNQNSMSLADTNAGMVASDSQGLVKNLGLDSGDLTIKWDGIDEFAAEYDRVQSIVDNAHALVDRGIYSEEELKEIPLLNQLEDFLTKYKQDVEEYRTQKELLQKYSTEQTLADSQLKGDINLQEVDNAVKYLEQKKKVVEEIQSILNKAGDTSSDASKMADTYLKEQFGNLYNQYDEVANLINQIAEKTGQLPDGIEQIFKQMDQSQLGALLNIDGLDLITSWEELYEIIKSISEIDFRNLEQVKQAAIGNFNTLQGVQDNVKKGQGIDADAYASLTPEIQSFFEIALDGTYKLKGNAQDFYNAIDDAKLQGFIQTAGRLADQQQKLANLKSSNFNYENLDKMVTNTGSNGAQMANQDQVDSQLAYLQVLGQTDGALAAQVQIWKSLSDQEKYSAEIAEEIYQKIGQVGDQTTDLQEKTKQLEDQVANLSRLWMDATVPLDQDISADAVAELADYIQEIAEESQDFSDALATDRDAAENVAEAILRFNDAIDDVSKNYKDWIKQLESGADGIEDQASLVGDLRDAYGDLLDIDGSNLSKEFVLDPENLNLMKAALEGDLDAYNRLANAVSEDIQVQIVEANPEWAHTIQGEFDYLRNLINNNPMAIEADPSGAMNAFQHVADAAFQMTGDVGAATQLINDYASSLGYDVALKPIEGEATDTTEEYDITKVTSQKPVRETRPVYRTQTFAGKEEQVLAGTTTETGWTTSIDTRITPVTAEGTKKTTAVGLQVTKVGKGATGAAKIGNAKKAKIGSGGGKGKGGGGKKKKGGGGSSTPKADTSQKDTKKPLKNDLDIYHDVNIQIGKINRNLNRAQKQQQRLFGKDLLKNLTDQRDLLEEHNQKLKKKHELQVTDLANQRKALQSLGVTFDKLGNINNYMTVLQGKQKTVNDLINQYNKKIEQYNKSTNKTNKEKIAKEAEKISKKIEEAEDVYKDLEDKIGNYDDLREEMQELLDQIQENTQQQIELTIQGFRTELEIRLDLGQAERDWNEFRRNVLQKTNVLKDMEFDEIFKDALKNIDDIYTYIGKEGSIGTITTLMQQLEDTQAEIEQMDKEGGVSLIYGTNKAQAMEDLQSDLDQLMSQLEDIEDLVNEIDEAYLDTIDDIADQFDAQIQGYEYVGELLEHDMDLLSLLYGDKNYDVMNRYYTALAENNNKQLDFLREQANYWQQNWVKAMEEGNVQAAKEFEEHYKDTIDNLNSLISDSVENLQDKYINAIEQIFDTLDRKITNGKGMDYLGMEWDLLNKNAEDYLDTINAAFAVQDLERKYNKALGETTSIKNQRALKKVMDEQLNNLKAKDKLTQYDVDRAEKLLEIEKARIALEDVRAQKTSLRLKRDSQGNYSYEYVADMDEVAEAQEALAAAQNDLYNFDKEQYQSNVDEVLAAWQDFQSEYKDIITDLSLTEEDRVNKLKLLREQYGKYINNKTAENAIIRVNLMDSAFADLAAIYEQDVQNYMQMADEEKDIIMNQLVPAWSSGVQEMANLIINEGGFVPVCQQAFDSIAEVTEEYAKELQTLGLIAGVNFEELKEGADYVADGMASLIKQNNELISSMKMEMEAIDLLRKQAQQLSKDYNDVTSSAAAAVTKIQEFVKAQKTAAAQAAKENKPATTASKNSSSSTTSKTTSTNNSSNNSTNNKNSTSNTSSNTSSSGTSTAKKTTSELAQDIYNKLKETMLNGGSSNNSKSNQTQITGGGAVRHIARLATGGYTGEWNSEEGRLAFLHEKELVLNEQDTKNVLNSVSILRTLMGSLNTTVANKIFDLNHGNRTSLLQSVGNNENVSQAVQISATFPNVNSRREIEEAFNNLVNMAAQRALE